MAARVNHEAPRQGTRARSQQRGCEPRAKRLFAVDRREPVERFVKEIGVNYPVLLADVAWLDELKTMGNPQSVLPFSLAVSPAGEVLLRRVGRLKYSEIASMIG